MSRLAEQARVAFRVDAGWAVGTGHVMRCLTVARALREAGLDCRFVSRAHDGHMAAAIEAAGFGVTLLPVDPAFRDAPGYEAWRGGAEDEDAALTAEAIAAFGGADILVVDHYGLGVAFESALRPHVRGLVSFDDLGADRRVCDVVIDQNIGHEADRFDGLLPAASVRLVGADYAPLRTEFADAREAALARRRALAGPKTLLVSVGGADADDATGKVLAALASDHGGALGWIERADVVLTSSSRHLEAVRRAAAGLPNVALHVDCRDMAGLMAAADLAIGGGGVTAIERCVMGLPSLIVVMAENQTPAAAAIEARGAGRTLGAPDELSIARITSMLAEAGAGPERLLAMAEAAAELCDGLGLSRIIPEIVALTRSAPARAAS